MIIVNTVSKTFVASAPWFKKQEKKTVLDNISFTLPDAAISAILGPNGAGKTTFLRILAGLETPDSGKVSINGYSVESQQQKIAYLSDGCGLYLRLSGEENIRYFGQLYGLTNHQIKETIQKLTPDLGLQSLLGKKVSNCSLGERMRISLARALIHDPHTIVLDEPTNGLDLASIRKLRQYLRYLATTRGKCILISTHHLHEVEVLADYVMVLVNGQIKAIGTPADITKETGHLHFEEAFAKLAFSESSL